MGLLDDVINTLAIGKTPSIEQAESNVLAYAGTYLKGQKNSDKHRKIREDILFAIITDVVGTKNPQESIYQV